MSMNLIMDLVADWHNLMIEEMTSRGLQFSPSTRKGSLVIRYITYLRKIGGPPRPRRVHRSKELTCPPEMQNGLNKLIAKLETGQDITPHLSKKVDDLSEMDLMFNDWGVLHLHLGERPDPQDPRFVERTGPLLFLYLFRDDAYLINVYRHGDWTKKSILQTVQDNWPHILKPYIMEGAIDLEFEFSEKHHAKLRKVGVVVLNKLRDSSGNHIVLVPPGMGMATSRDPSVDIRTYDAAVRVLGKIEDEVCRLPWLVKESRRRPVVQPMRVNLVKRDGTYMVIEQTTNTELYEVCSFIS